jgi:selenium-binding protein 1
MKITNKKNKPLNHLITACAFTALTLVLTDYGMISAQADETCQSPYMAKIVGRRCG